MGRAHVHRDAPALSGGRVRAALSVLRRGVAALLVTWPLGAASAEIEWQPVAPQVWRVPGAQVVLVRDGARTWLIGSGPTPAVAAALGETIRRRFGRAVTDVVVTRAAPELAMGLIAFADARTWALPDVIAQMRTRCEACRMRLRDRLGEIAGASLVAPAVRMPTRAVTGARLGPFDARVLERAPGEPALVLRHRGTRVVIAQGLLWPGDVPDLHDTEGAALLASWARLHDFAQGASLLGEPGPVATSRDIVDHVNYVTALHDALTPRALRGDDRAAMGLGVELPAFADRPGYALRHPLNVQRAYREIENARLR